MRFGYVLSNQFLPSEDPVVRFHEQIEQVRFAGSLGFTSVWASQHYLSREFQYLHQVPVLGRILSETGTMRIGTAIALSALENPVALAEQFATLDVISGGRLTVGVGLGYRDVEFDAFGVPSGRRVHRFMENLDIMRRLWTQDTVAFHGAVVRLDAAGSALKPIQKPHPPVWMGGHTEGAIRRAVDMGFPWIAPAAHLRAEFVEQRVAFYRAAWRAEYARDPQLPLVHELYVAEDGGQAVEDVRQSISAKYSAYRYWQQDAVLPASERFDEDFDDLRKDRFILGDVETCIDGLSRLIEHLGPTDVCLRMQWPGLSHEKVMRSMEILWQEVVPAVRARLGIPRL